MEQQKLTIFDYQSPRQFLLDRVSEIQKNDPEASLRALGRKMGMKSHTLLFMLLQGKRPIRVKHSLAIARGLELSSQELLYLQALIQFDQADDLDEKKLCALWLSDLHPNVPFRVRQIDQAEIVSNWIHMAILAVSGLKDFDPSPEWIARRFGKKTTTAEVRAALERLKSFGLIEDAASGKFNPAQNRTTTMDDVPSQAVRAYHRQAMGLADRALDEVALDRREFQSFSVAIPNDRIGLAKEMIRKFRSQFSKAMSQEKADDVYQLSIQFFQLTESPERMVHSEDEGADTDLKVK